MIDRLRTIFKWLLPIAFVLMVFFNPEVRRLLFVAKSNHEDMTQAGILYNFSFLREQAEQPNTTNTTNGIIVPLLPVVKNPFDPSNFDLARKEDKQRSDLLEGIVIEGNKHYALIAGKRVAEGESIMGMRVISIRNNKVFLASNSRIRIITLF